MIRKFALQRRLIEPRRRNTGCCGCVGHGRPPCLMLFLLLECSMPEHIYFINW
jgi:hypothetical protein